MGNGIFHLENAFLAMSRSILSSAALPSAAMSDSVTPRQAAEYASPKEPRSRYWNMGEESGTSIVVMEYTWRQKILEPEWDKKLNKGGK